MRLLSQALLLVVVTVLVTHTEAGWVKKTLNQVGKKVGTITKDTLRRKAVESITDVVKRYGPMFLAHAMGKRSVKLPFLGIISDKRAQDVINALDLACTGFAGTKQLTPEDVQFAFGASDGDKDKNLSSEEFSLFENTVEAVQHCLELIKIKGK